MAGDYDFFGAGQPATQPEPNGAGGAPAQPGWAPAWTPPPRRAGIGRRLALVVLAATAVGAATAASRVSFAKPYDNLVAHEEVSSSPTGWAPLYTSGGKPSRWDPCTPIHYVVNTQYAPPSGVLDLKGALLRIEKATGLHFVLDGETGELPRDRQSATVRRPDGSVGWAPLLIAWEPMGDADGVEGLTLPIAVAGPDGGSIITARVSINSDLLLPPGFGPGVSEGLVILHELGHAVGLGHIGDPAQVMYPRVKGGYADFGSGDRAGLKALGAPAGCHPAPAARELRLKVDGTG